MKKILFSLIIMLALVSCKKDEITPTPITPNTNFSILGTWVLESAKVSIDGKDVTILKADITKGGFFKTTDLETTFGSDGKFARGTETGNYVIGGGDLSIGTIAYKFTSSDLVSFNYGNAWISGDASTNALQADVFFVSQKILDNVSSSVPNTAKNVSYRFYYKKK